MADKKTLLGVAIGVGATLAVPLAAPVLGSALRPLVKTAVKQALLAAASVRERLAVAAEDLDDLVAEIRAEVSEELARKGPRPRRVADEPAASEAEANGISGQSRSGVPS